MLRRALEDRGGNPCVALAASDYGALLAIFATPEAREETMALFPLSFDGHTICLERPEEGSNRFTYSFSLLVQVSATGFPLEHWNEAGIRAAFLPFGSVCCIDPLCLDELDFSAVRLVLKLADGGEVPHTLLMRDCHGGSSAEVSLRSVRSWPFDDDLATMPYAHFDSFDGNHDSPPAGGAAGHASRMDDIDIDSVMGVPPPLPPPPRWPRQTQRRCRALAADRRPPAGRHGSRRRAGRPRRGATPPWLPQPPLLPAGHAH
jgi:hypothetical protein